MNTFPLVKPRWSNEHIMAAVFFVLLLYMLPQWTKWPAGILIFTAVSAAGLLVDVAANFIRYRRPVCAVSAAITAAMLQVLTPGVPVWGQMLGVTAALLIGKHIWGGTGKNIINPAITGLLLLSIVFGTDLQIFTPSLFLIPAVLLSIPFIIFRPFASSGLMIGMTAALFISRELSIQNIITYGVIFWGCLVITDPVTTTPRPLSGSIGGFLAGFVPLLVTDSAYAMAFAVILFNMLSAAAERFDKTSYNLMQSIFRVRRVIPSLKEKTFAHDLTGEEMRKTVEGIDLTREEILRRIDINQVFGAGGAAFPTIRKVKAVIESDVPAKYFIINGVECDPGLIHDKWLLRNFPEEIYKGIKLICKCVSFEEVILAVKDTEGLNLPEDLTIQKVPEYYPVGAEKILIDVVLKKKIPQETVPAQEGILVLNVQTVYWIFEAVYRNKKIDTRFLTVADAVGKTGQVAKAKLGSRIRDIAEKAYPSKGLVFAGGGLMQARPVDDEDVVDRTVNFIAVGHFPNYKESPICSKCGLCTINCPALLKPGKIGQLVEGGQMEEAAKLQAEKCLSCGSCSYVCLAGRDLHSKVKAAKDFVLTNREESIKSKKSNHTIA